MTKIFDIVPSWLYAIAVVALLALAGLQQVRLANERSAHAQTRVQYAQQVADAQEATRIASEKNRSIEQELRDVQEIAVQQTQALLEVVERARAADRVASQRLRDAAQDLAAVARSRCAAATTPGYSTPGDDPIGVLADVLGRADQRAGELAAVADESRIRGLTCERAYDTARAALSG